MVQKEKTKESVRLQVNELLKEMYEEQKAKTNKKQRESRNFNNFDNVSCKTNQTVQMRAITIGLSFIELWIDIHLKNIDEKEISKELCNIIMTAKKWGESSYMTAKTLQNHLEYLIDEKFICE